MTIEFRRGLPEGGVPADHLIDQLVRFKEPDFDWRSGRLPIYTFPFRDDVLDVQKRAYSEFIAENSAAYTSNPVAVRRVLGNVPRMLDDIRDWTLDLFAAPADAGFSFTSGGTESILLAVKASRDRAREARGEERGHFNIVAPESAHAGLDKAAAFMDVEVRRVPVGTDRRSDVDGMRDAMDDRTILLFASAPSNPFGLFDRIEELGELALERSVGLHIDACWGGFVSPFAKELGYRIPAYDFAVPGITSLSADINKFGFGAKGASVLIYRDAKLKKFEGFSFSDWPVGLYQSSTWAGSGPTGQIATAWAVMQYLGRSGYRSAVGDAMRATQTIADGAAKIDGLAPLDKFGESNLLNLVSIDSSLSIFAVADELELQGWFRGRLQKPQTIHQGVNPAHLGVVDEYLTALGQAVANVRSRVSVATLQTQ